MKNSITIISQKRGAGDTVIILGIMDLIKQNYENVGIFKPLYIQNQLNSEIETLIKLYDSDQERIEIEGVPVNVAESIILHSGLDMLIDAILERHQYLKENYDFVLSIGEDVEHLNEIIGMDINVEIAKRLSSPVIGVFNGKDLTSDEIIDNVKLWADNIMFQGGDIFMLFVNKCNKKSYENLKQINKRELFKFPIAFLPFSQDLARLTLADIMEHLPVEWLAGEKEHIQHDIGSFKMGTMTLEVLIKSFKAYEFIITSTDRVDLLLGVLTSAQSINTPISGGVLLCGKPIDESVINLLNGLESIPLPILYTNWHEHELIPEAVKIKPSIRFENRRKVASALNLFYQNINSEDILNRFNLVKSNVITPVMFRLKLFEKAKNRVKNIILSEVEDDRVLLASDVLLRRKVVNIILVGSKYDILRRAKRLGVDLSLASILDPREKGIRKRYAKSYYEITKDENITLEMAYDIVSHNKIVFSTIALYLGEADGMVGGAIHPGQEIINSAIQVIKAKSNYGIVSSCYFICMPTKVLIYAYCVINSNPTAEELATIAIETVENVKNFDIQPRVAMITTSPRDKDEIKKIEKATRILEDKMPNLLVAGPIEYDVAVNPEISKVKMANNPLSGQANILIFPNLNAGNVAYKAVQRNTDSVKVIGAIMQGLNKPVNDLSMSDSVDDVIDMITITAIQAQGNS